MNGNQNNDADSSKQVPLDPVKVAHYVGRLRSEQNLVLGVVAGIVASALGAVLWAVITVVTGYQIGFVAIGVGLLVGFAVRLAGKGIDTSFGIIGAILALLGCLAGNSLGITAIAARNDGLPFFVVLRNMNPELAWELMKISFSPIDLFFYGLAVYEGFRFSFRRLSDEELRSIIPAD